MPNQFRKNSKIGRPRADAPWSKSRKLAMPNGSPIARKKMLVRRRNSKRASERRLKKEAGGHKQSDSVVGRDRSPRRSPSKAKAGRAGREITTENIRGAPGGRALPDLSSAKARFIEPMKARLVEQPPAAGDWIYELKFDGIRLIAVKNGSNISLFSRNKNELARRFPEIVEAIRNLPARECVIDGEVVALDEEGRSSFQLLQAREMEGRTSPIYFYAFDLLQLDGKSLMSLPLEARKNILEQLCADASDRIRYSGAIGGDA